MTVSDPKEQNPDADDLTDRRRGPSDTPVEPDAPGRRVQRCCGPGNQEESLLKGRGRSEYLSIDIFDINLH